MSIDDVYNSLTAEERKELSIIKDPVRWAEATLRDPRDADKHLSLRSYQRDMLSSQPIPIKNKKGEKKLNKRLKVYRCGRRTGKSTILAIESLWHAFTKSNYRVLVVAPFESQIRELFKNMSSLMNNSFVTPSRQVKKPFIIEFSNGSRIIGYTAGASSSSKGSGIRGQSADLIVADEIDRGIDDVIESVLFPIFYGNSQCQMIMSSTPSGRHGLFWEICNNEDEWDARQFHVPSSEIPGWDEKSERMAKQSAKTETRYKHEYCLLPDEKIITNNGNKKIKDINIGDKVYSDGNICEVINHKCTGVKDTIKLETNFGSVSCSTDHNFYVRGEKVKAKDTKELTIQPKNRLSNLSDKEKWSAIIGFLYGDGTILSSRKVVGFCSEYFKELKIIKRLIRELNIQGKGKIKKKPDVNCYELLYGSELYDKLVGFGCTIGKRVDKLTKIPSFIKNGSKKVKSIFISSLLGTDGNTVDNQYRKPLIAYTKNNPVHANKYGENIIKIIEDLGFKAVLRNGGNNYRIYFSINNWYDFFIKFYQEIGYIFSWKKELELLSVYGYAKKYRKLLKEKNKLWKNIKEDYDNDLGYNKILSKYNISKKIYCKAIHCKKPKRLYNEIESYKSFRNKYLGKRGLYIPIISKKFLSYRKVYNLTVDSDDHSYTLSNNILTYNCAEFGELEEGLFQNKYIKNILKDYEFEDLPYDPRNNYYFMGVDWNEIYGVSISIVEKSKEEDNVRLWKKDLVERSQYTQPEAVDKIIEWSEKIRFKAIYVDAGAGGAQTQWLKKHGENNKNSNLNKVLRMIDFSSNIFIRDSVTNKKKKKRAKPFMVDNCIYFVENNLISIPKSENREEGLVDAMRGYKVKKISNKTNKPVYTCEVEDHELDALFLALLSVTMETTDLGKSREHGQVSIIKDTFGYLDKIGSRVKDNKSSKSNVVVTSMPGKSNRSNFRRPPKRKNISSNKRKGRNNI